MALNSYHQYKVQSVLTMTKEELVVVLFDELLTRLKRAELCVEHSQFAVFDESVNRAEEIVKYLEDSLNHEYEISAELARMYEYFKYEIIRIKAGRRVEVIKELIPLVTELRDTFDLAQRKV